MSVAARSTGAASEEPGAARTVFARRLLVDERVAVAGYRLVQPAGPMGPAANGPFGPPAAGEAPMPMPEFPDASGGLAPSRHPNFLRCHGADLVRPDGPVAVLDSAKVVLEMVPSPGEPTGEPPFDLSSLRKARGAGFRLAFDVRWLNEDPRLVDFAAFALLPLGAVELDRAAGVARALHGQGVKQVVVTGVRTGREFERLAGAGVRLFEGLWFTRPALNGTVRAAAASHASLLRLMNLVRVEAELEEIEDVLRREPTLSYRLLRYINTSGFGRHLEISSFRHAVMTVGMRRLFRWTAILLASTPSDSLPPAAGTLAITRGRVMELLAAGAMPPAEAELAFVAGMFSMLDVLLDVPLAEALSLVSLPAEVSAAVLEGEGHFAPYLAMAKACESGDEGLLEILAMRHAIARDRMVEAHVRALDWAERLD
jgi:EAL and modified HD-GYP domain-containing signal transduction protein